jgi:hypothetical protein
MAIGRLHEGAVESLDATERLLPRRETPALRVHTLRCRARHRATGPCMPHTWVADQARPMLRARTASENAAASYQNLRLGPLASRAKASSAWRASAIGSGAAIRGGRVPDGPQGFGERGGYPRPPGREGPHLQPRIGPYSCVFSTRSRDALATTTFRNYSVVARASMVPQRGRPILSHVAQSRARWREGQRLPAVESRHRMPTGTVFSFSLNEAASVRLSFRGKGSHKVLGTISVRTGKPAQHSASDGRLSKRKRLAVGTYVLTIIATNSRHETSAPHTLQFVIVS